MKKIISYLMITNSGLITGYKSNFIGYNWLGLIDSWNFKMNLFLANTNTIGGKYFYYYIKQ